MDIPSDTGAKLLVEYPGHTWFGNP